MKTRKINITFEIEDNDLIQYNFEKLLETIVGKDKITHLEVFPNTDNLKNNETYKALLKDKKNASKELGRFINNNR